jgi:hypothetical protein
MKILNSNTKGATKAVMIFIRNKLLKIANSNDCIIDKEMKVRVFLHDMAKTNVLLGWRIMTVSDDYIEVYIRIRGRGEQTVIAVDRNIP